MDQTATKDNFETFLVDRGFVTKAVYEKAKEESIQRKKTVISILAEEKLLDGENLAQARAAFLNIPYINFKDQKIDQKILEIVPVDTRNFYHFFAFEKNGSNLKIAIIDPTNLQALEALEFISKKNGYNIQLYVTDDASFLRVFSQKENIKKIVGEALEDIEEIKQEEQKKKAVPEQKELQQVIQDAPVSKIVDIVLTNAIEGSASDIHIEPLEKELRVRYRIDGILHTVLVLPKDVENAVVSRIKIMSVLKIDEQRLPQDGRFHYETPSKQVDLRVSILPNVNGEKVVMRILDKTTKVPTLEQLGFRGKALDWTMENIKKTHGIFLITGPTGSGKSTTLYSLLSMLNQPTVNIVTLEDPVEYFMAGVNQSQVNPDIGFTFASGLRSILRQDPNIIMVGEIRDKETAELAVHSALTGHLVFSTLHTNNAIGALPRMVDMGIEPFLLIASINAIGAQRLTRKICDNCKQEIEMSPEVEKDLRDGLKGVSDEELQGLDMKTFKIYAGKGCEKCGNTGYKGRVAIVELLAVSPKIQDMVIAKASPVDMLEEAKKAGMITMKQDGIIKILKGVTTYEEVMRVTSE